MSHTKCESLKNNGCRWNLNFMAMIMMMMMSSFIIRGSHGCDDYYITDGIGRVMHLILKEHDWMGIRVLDRCQGIRNPSRQQERNCFPEIMKAKAKAIHHAELREAKDTTHLSFFYSCPQAGNSFCTQITKHPDSPPIPSTSLYLYLANFFPSFFLDGPTIFENLVNISSMDTLVNTM